MCLQHQAWQNAKMESLFIISFWGEKDSTARKHCQTIAIYLVFNISSYLIDWVRERVCVLEGGGHPSLDEPPKLGPSSPRISAYQGTRRKCTSVLWNTACFNVKQGFIWFHIVHATRGNGCQTWIPLPWYVPYHTLPQYTHVRCFNLMRACRDVMCPDE